MLLLHFFTGCSDNSGEGMEDLTPATGNIGNKVVLYEANPKIFAQTNALAAITTRLDEIKSFGKRLSLVRQNRFALCLCAVRRWLRCPNCL